MPKSKIHQATCSLFITSLFLLLFAGCGRTQNLQLSGTVEAQEAHAVPEVSGKILELPFDEGTFVQKGDIIAIIDDQTQQLSVSQLEAAVKAKQAVLQELNNGSRPEQVSQARAGVNAAKAQLDEAIRGSRPEQIKQAEAGVAIAQSNVDSAQVSLDYSQKNYDRSLQLYNEGTLNTAGLDEARFKLDTAETSLHTAQEQLASAKAQLELAQSGAGDEAVQAARANYDQAAAQLELVKNGPVGTTIDAAQADLDHSQAALDQGRLQLSRYKISSPIDGVISLLPVTKGEIVNAGGTAATIIDQQDKYVHFYIPQRYLSLVRVGQEVYLNLSSLPGTPVKGKITFIAPKAEFTPRNTETNESKENTVFKFKVRVMDYLEQVQPGMTANITFPVPENLQ
jgi:HlyD family secretion protein